MMDAYPFDGLAVVPIFVNAGTAILPAILAPLASVLALLVRPRELVRACRRRPWAPALVVLAGVGVYFMVVHLVQGTAAKAGPAAQVSATGINWVALAEEHIRRQRAGLDDVTTGTSQAGSHGAVVFRYGYDRCGHDGGPALIDLKTEPLWQVKIDDAMFLSSPAVFKDRVYAATTTLEPISGNFGQVVCVEAKTGKVIWKTEEIDGEWPKPFFSSPAITADGKYLVIGQGLHDDKDSYLMCFDTEKGTLKWKIKTPLHIEGSPAIHGDMVVAGAGAIEVGPDKKPEGDPGFVIAVRISDGKELWRYRLADPESSPAIAPDGTVYIGSGWNGNAVVALRSETDEHLRAKSQSRLIWSTPTIVPIVGGITLAGDLVITGGGYGDYVSSGPKPGGIVVAMDRKTGDIRWQTKIEDSVLGAIAVAGDVAVCPGRGGKVLALSLADGRPLWSHPVSGKTPVLASPAYARGIAYAVSCDGYLGVIDARDPKDIKLQQVPLNGKAVSEALTLSSPMIAGGCVFVGTQTGGLRCYVGNSLVE